MPVSPATTRDPKTEEDALDERDHIAVSVRGAQIGGVAAGGGIGRGHRRRGIGDVAPALVRVFLSDQALHLRIAEARVVQMPDAVLEGDLLGLYHHVGQLRPAQRRRIVAPQQIHHGQDDESLGHRRLLQELVAPVVGAQGLHPLGELSLQIPFLDQSALGLYAGAHARRHVAAVEALPTVAGDGLQHPCQLRLPQQPPRRQILQRFTKISLDARPRGSPVLDGTGEGKVQREAVPGQGHGVGADLGQIHGAVPAVELQPTVHRSGDRDAQGPGGGNRVQAAFPECLDGGIAGGRAAGVERPDLSLILHMDEAEQVAAEAAGLVLDHGQDEPRGHCRIHGVAALLHDLEAGQGRQRMAGGNDALGAHDERARGLTITNFMCRLSHDSGFSRDSGDAGVLRLRFATLRTNGGKVSTTVRPERSEAKSKDAP